ncbi:MAG: phosphatase PAP2 family protein [Salinivirgaceae bacterium]|jgi:undecaprenyl-diphosphatase|nr:phosphatase PAP2 family protein [Bacteroidales bacterium]
MIVQADEKLFLFLNGLHCEVLDFLMWHISGKYIWIVLYAILLYAIIKKYKLQGLFFVLGIVLTIIATDQISVLIKNSVERFRPTHNPDFGHLVHVVRNYRGGDYGFISSHAANCFGLATFIALIFQKRWITVSMLFWAALVSYSRIYLGVHYPGDVICGGILGVIVAYLMFLGTRYLLRLKKSD